MLVKRSGSHNLIRWLFAKPARMIVTSFLFLDIVGTILLCLPIATQSRESIGIFDALFTTVSCTCVTGLVVLDTATTFSAFGKIVMVILIQLGGLSLITITSIFLNFARKRVGLKAKLLAQESSGSFSFMELPALLKSIIMTTFLFEFVGCVLLSTQFIPLYGIKNGIGKAGFMAISAFCNAGFDLMGNTASGPYSSLTAANGNPVIMFTIGFLIIFGGLGFVVWRDILSFYKTRKLRLQSKIAIIMTSSLVIFGMLFFLAVEWNNPGEFALGGLPAWQKPIAAFFQSVTMRTAGFNSINMSNLYDGTKLISVVLMFIGAGSGSTGGGIKVSTFMLLVYAVVAEIRGRGEVIVLKNKIAKSAVSRAISIFVLGLMVMVGLSLILTFTETAALRDGTFEYLDLLFESASAFGTVGVSAAQTQTLTSLSQLFIIPVMFIGRVGPIAFAITLAIREPKPTTNVYPESKIQLG
jgi:trk system potassium uptake protein TrkH